MTRRDELYGEGVSGNRLRGDLSSNRKVIELLQRHHQRGNAILSSTGYCVVDGHAWRVPMGVQHALHARLTFAQIASKYPWYVTWVSPTKRRRFSKNFMDLSSAILFVTKKAQYLDPAAAVVSHHGMYIPIPLMGKFPRKMGKPPRTHYWCPRCMCPRRFARSDNGDTFYAMKKEWSNDKLRYEMKDRRLALLSCTICGGTNRDSKFRSSNQPVSHVVLRSRARTRRR